MMKFYSGNRLIFVLTVESSVVNPKQIISTKISVVNGSPKKLH